MVLVAAGRFLGLDVGEVNAGAAERGEAVGELVVALGEGGEEGAGGLVGVAAEGGGAVVAVGVAGDGDAGVAAEGIRVVDRVLKGDGAVDVDAAAGLAEVPHAGGLEAVVAVGLHTDVAGVDAGVEVGFLELGLELPAGLEGVGRVDDLGVVVGAEGFAAGEGEEVVVHQLLVGGNVHGLDGLELEVATDGVVARF